MNFKNKLVWLFCTTITFNPCFAMLTRVSQATRQRLTTQQLANQRALLRTQTHYMTQPIKTAPIAKASPAPASSTGFFARIQNSLWTNWNAFKNIFAYKTPTISTPPQETTSPLPPHISPIGQSELSMFIPTATIQTLKRQALESAFKVIKENRKEFDLKNGMDGLIVCGYPGPELLVLSKIKSATDFERFFSNKRKQAFKTIGFSDNEINSMMATIEQNRKNVIKEFYTQPIATTKRDQDLPKNIIETTDKILMKAGLNPDCVSLIQPTLKDDTLTTLLGVAADALGAYKNEEKQTIELAILRFFFLSRITIPKRFNFLAYVMTINLTTFIIAHEIGHLIKNHTNEIKYLNSMLEKQLRNYAEELQKNNPSLDVNETISILSRNIAKELLSLYELEADATVALLEPEIAQAISREILNEAKIRKKTPYSLIHSSPRYKHELMQKILQIHALEKTQQQPHSAIE